MKEKANGGAGRWLIICGAASALTLAAAPALAHHPMGGETPSASTQVGQPIHHVGTTL